MSTNPIINLKRLRLRLTKRSAQRAVRRDLGSEIKLWFIAVICGIIVGHAMAGLRISIHGLEYLAFGRDDDRLITAASALAPWRVMLMPFLGGCIVAVLLWIGSKIGWGKNPRMGGIADVVWARRHTVDRYGRLTDLTKLRLGIKDGLLTAAIAITSLGFGASAGREGPAVHIGAVLAGANAKWLKLTPAQIRALLGCGAAAAVASSFNAPLAGLVFAHEVILGRYRITDIGPIAASSVAGALISRLYFGNDALFTPPEISNMPIGYFTLSPVMGLLAAFVAIVIIRTWVNAPRIGESFARYMRFPIWMLPPFAGMIIGIFALAFPQILGVGYESTATAMAGGYGPLFLLILALAKIGATALSLGCRFGGGVFSGSIFVGAMVGGTFGALAGLIFGDPDSGQIFFTVVGMGAVSGAVLGAPISTTLIIFELTGSYETMAAVLVAVSLATVLVQAIVGGSAFDQQLKDRRIKKRQLRP